MIHAKALRRWTLIGLAMLAVGALVASWPRAGACPFCSATMQTLSQEIAGADAAVIAQLVKPMPALAEGAAPSAAAAAKFRIIETLRGAEKLAGAKEIDVVYFGQDPPEKKFLISGIAAVTPDKLDWTTPVPLSDRAEEYVRKLPSVPETGADRLAFFQEYLEDEDRLLAQDSYDEFARMPYADVIALGPRMHREKLLAWIDDPGVGPSGRRLYLTMLGICGQPGDVAMLERLLNYDYQAMKPGIAAMATTASGGAPVGLGPVGMGLVDEMLHADERRKKESLDALIACYLKLKGPEGLELINEKFFRNAAVEYKHLHSAIMALRFHGEETKILPREKLLESMRLALEHQEFADQVIPDLTRWEDWEIMPRLVKMFKESSSDDWIRQPVVSYLLVAEEQPGEVGERAKSTLKELETLDPETVERARSLQAFNVFARPAAVADAAADSTAAATADAATAGAVDAGASGKAPGEVGEVAAAAGPAGVNPGARENSAARGDVAARAKGNAVAKAAPVVAVTLSTPGRLKLIGVPLLAAGVLLAVFAVLLRGTDPRSSDES